MYLKNEILSINLAQYGENPEALDTYTIQLGSRQTDASAYEISLTPLTASTRLFNFDLTPLGVNSGQYIAVILKDGTPITMFNVRKTTEDTKYFYEPGIVDSIYQNTK